MKVSVKEAMYNFCPGLVYKAEPAFYDGRPMVKVYLPGTKVVMFTDWDNLVVLE